MSLYNAISRHAVSFKPCEALSPMHIAQMMKYYAIVIVIKAAGQM